FVMPCHSGHSYSEQESASSGIKCSQSNALQMGPRKCPCMVINPLVHHGCHFGCVIHAFCNVQTLLTNGITLMGDVEERGLKTLTQEEREEYSAYQELLKIVPKLEKHVMTSSKEAVITIAELIQKGASGARADNTNSMKATIIDWITLKGQTLIPHIPRNVKTG
ncbi:hypothetical protein PISMIDRAFT_103551, partial [Pisolithus microcarpus 441]